MAGNNNGRLTNAIGESLSPAAIKLTVPSWLFGEFVPGMAAVIEDVVVVSEDAVGEPVVAQELPDVPDRVEFRRSGRERQQGGVVGDLERRGGMLPETPGSENGGDKLVHGSGGISQLQAE